MPAHINYETTPIIFYKFICENPEIRSCYVGQTTNFQQRYCSHKHRFNCKADKNTNLKIYQIIRENGGWDNWKMVEIDRQICLDKSDACRIEQSYIDELHANMNSHYAFRNRQQYRLDNKPKHGDYCKQYYLDNKEILHEYAKKYNLINQENISIKHKEYNLNNKESISKNKKEYYLNNKNKILEKQKQKHDCLCGGRHRTNDKSKHERTQRHLAYLKTLENIPL
jgi:hypothetical protein